jgi:hypothetical protein
MIGRLAPVQIKRGFRIRLCDAARTRQRID